MAITEIKVPSSQDCKKLLEVLTDLFNSAKDHKQAIGVDDEFNDAQDLYNGELKLNHMCDADGSLSFIVDNKASPRSDKASSLVKNLIALIREFYVNIDYKVFEVRNTALPRLSPEEEARMIIEGEEKIRQVADKLEFNQVNPEVDTDIAQYLSEVPNDVDENEAKELVIDRVRSLQEQYINDARFAEAKRKTDELNSRIRDLLQESNLLKTLKDIVEHVCVDPTAIIKDKVYKYVDGYSWANGRYVYSSENEKKTFELVSPYDIFPDENATNLQEAEYIFELSTMSSLEFSRYIRSFDDDAKRDKLEKIKSISNKYYEVYTYYGTAELLAEYVDDIDEDSFVEIVFTSEDIISINDLTENDKRQPFYSISFYEPSSKRGIWGSSPASKLVNAQKRYMLIEDYGMKHTLMSLSHMTEINRHLLSIDKISEDTHTKMISPFAVVMTDNPESNQPLFRIHQLQSNVRDLIAMKEEMENEFYKCIGISQAVFGDMRGISAAARTSGNLAIILDRTDAAISQVIEIIDRNFIEPLIRNTIKDIIADDPETNWGDETLMIKGVFGLAREQSKTNVLKEFLGMLSQYPQSLESDTIKTVINDIGLLEGIDMKKLLPEFNEQQGIAKSGLSRNIPMQNSSSLAQPGQGLDGRSATAVSKLNVGVGG